MRTWNVTTKNSLHFQNEQNAQKIIVEKEMRRRSGHGSPLEQAKESKKGESHKWLFKHPRQRWETGTWRTRRGDPQKNQKQRGSMITPTAGKEAVAEAELSLCISMNWKGEAAERAQPCQIWILTIGGRRILVEFTKLRWVVLTF